MQCPQCKTMSTDTRRCTQCGTSFAGTSKWNKNVGTTKDVASPDVGPAALEVVPTWWLTKQSIIGSTLIIVGFVTMMLTVDYAPPATIEEGFARSAMKGNSDFMKPGPYRVVVFLEWSAIIVGVILWSIVAKRHYFTELKQISKSASEKISDASSSLKGAVNRRIAKAPETDPMETLRKLKELKDQGIVTEEEFAAKKAEIMSKI